MRKSIKKSILVFCSLTGILFFSQIASAESVLDRVKGYILLQVQQHGEAWYINPTDNHRYYMKDGGTAYEMLRTFGLGITDADLAKIPSVPTPEKMLDAASACNSYTLARQLKGRIVLQVEAHGEAWYIYPPKCLRIYLKNGESAYDIMRYLGLGIIDKDLSEITIGYIGNGPKYTDPTQQKNFVTSFHYQLQNTEFENLINLDVDALVIDQDEANLTTTQISQLASKFLLLGYINIGEAEDYRSYWQDDWRPGYPSYIDEAIPNEPGKYTAKFYDTNWQTIQLTRMQSLAEQGYEGAYLDGIESYKYYQERSRGIAVIEMINFIRQLKSSGQTKKSGFLVVPQNAPELFTFDTYKDIVDGLGIEDTWYKGDQKIAITDTDNTLQFLDLAIVEGKFVLSIDKPTATRNVCDFYQQCRSHGFACTVNNTELSLDEDISCN